MFLFDDNCSMSLRAIVQCLVASQVHRQRALIIFGLSKVRCMITTKNVICLMFVSCCHANEQNFQCAEGHCASKKLHPLKTRSW